MKPWAYSSIQSNEQLCQGKLHRTCLPGGVAQLLTSRGECCDTCWLAQGVCHVLQACWGASRHLQHGQAHLVPAQPCSFEPCRRGPQARPLLVHIGAKEGGRKLSLQFGDVPAWSITIMTLAKLLIACCHTNACDS